MDVEANEEQLQFPQTVTLEQLPVEILYEILKILSVEDILRLSRVCRILHEITGNHTIWYNAYRSTNLPRPSGPHAWQDTNTLKRVLVRSAKVEKNWPRLSVNLSNASTTAAESEMRTYTPSITRRFMFSRLEHTIISVGSRWIVLITPFGISCVDLQSTEIPVGTSDVEVTDFISLYERTADDIIVQSPSTVVIADQERCGVAYVVVYVLSSGEPENSICLFKLYLPTETGQERCMRAELKGRIPVDNIDESIFGAVLAHNLLLIHVINGSRFPSCFLVSTETDSICQIKIEEGVRRPRPSFYLTSTHFIVVVARSEDNQIETTKNYIEAYCLPTLPSITESDDTSTIPQVQLHLSHKGIYEGHFYFKETLLWECGGHIFLIGLCHSWNLVVANLVLNSSSRFEEVGTITCTFRDIFTLPNGPTYMQLFFTATARGENRGIIYYKPIIGLYNKIPSDEVFGFTLALDPGPNDVMRFSFCAGKLELQEMTRVWSLIGFCGNTGRFFRERWSRKGMIVEMTDFT